MHPPLAGLQVAVEPAAPGGLPALERGLRLLDRADATVTVTLAEDSGEWLLGAAGAPPLELLRFAGGPPDAWAQRSTRRGGGAAVKRSRATCAVHRVISKPNAPSQARGQRGNSML